MVHEQLLTKAIKGEKGQSWCISSSYNYEEIRKKLLDTMKDQPEWAKLRIEMETGRMVENNIDLLIAHFKELAYAMDYDLEDEKTKELTVKILPSIFHPAVLRNPDGKYKAFSDLERWTIL